MRFLQRCEHQAHINASVRSFILTDTRLAYFTDVTKRYLKPNMNLLGHQDRSSYTALAKIAVASTASRPDVTFRTITYRLRKGPVA
jgi:hypothetical protein